MSNKKKSEQLGMSYGSAAHRLRKMLMFQMAQELKRDLCFQCGKRIEDVGDLSVEHKIPWLDSDDPIGLFFDLNNVAFSHLKCNIGAARQTEEAQHGGDRKYGLGCRCRLCVENHYRKTKLYRARLKGRGTPDFPDFV